MVTYKWYVKLSEKSLTEKNLSENLSEKKVTKANIVGKPTKVKKKGDKSIMEELNMYEDVKVYDFEKNKKFSPANMKYLSLILEEYCKSSNLQLQYELKNQSLKFVLNKTAQIKYSDFIEATSYDSVIVDFSIGNANNLVMKIEKSTVLMMIDLLLGGDGQSANIEREISNIDIEVFSYLVNTLFQKASTSIGNKKIEVKNIYTNTAQFKKSTSKDFTFTSDINVLLYGELIGVISFGIPYSSLEEHLTNFIVKKPKQPKNENTENLSELGEDILNSLQESRIALNVIAELGVSSITVGELLNINEDDVLILNRKTTEDIDVIIGDNVCYKAKPGLVGTSKAIMIRSSIEGDL